MAVVIFLMVAFFVAPIVAMYIHSFGTFMHCYGVAITSRKFCKILKYNAFETAIIMINAVYHDVGKLLISKEILHSTARLSDEERIIINGHATNPIARFYGVLFPAAIGHHKNFENDGYGAEKKQSKISAIIEICDVFDALTGLFRTYAQPREMKDIIRIMNLESKKFDPVLFNIFMSNIEEFAPSKKTVLMDAEYRTKA